jgi:hypothetical protein
VLLELLHDFIVWARSTDDVPRSAVPAVHQALTDVLVDCKRTDLRISGTLDGTPVAVTARQNGWSVVIETAALPVRLVACTRGRWSKRVGVTCVPQAMPVQLVVDELQPWIDDPVLTVVFGYRRIALFSKAGQHEALPDVVLLAGRLAAAARAMVTQATAALPTEVRGDAYRGEIDERPRREQTQQWAAAIAAFEDSNAYKLALYYAGG